MYRHKHAIRDKGSWRGFLYLWKLCFSLEVSTRWRSGFIARVAYGGQERFLTWTFAIPRLFVSFGIETPFKWHCVRPFDGKYGKAHRELGLGTINGNLLLYVGYDSMGTYYSTHGRGGWLGRWVRDIKRNQQVTLFRTDWILGRAKYQCEILEENIPVTVVVGQWPGDEYRGTASKERSTWRRRFSTKVVEGYRIDMEQGIPFPGKGENSWDCGDDAYFGFGGATIEGAIDRIVADTTRRRGKNWRPLGVSV